INTINNCNISMSEGSILNLIGAWTASLTGIAILFKAMEYTTPKDKKRSAANWLKSIADKSTSNTIVDSPQWFVESFDRIFGEKHLTWRCILISSISSIIAVFVMFIVWGLLSPRLFIEIVKYKPDIIVSVFSGCLLLNLVPDYISLLETRWIMNNVADVKIRVLSKIIILDAIITGFIFSSFFSIIFLISGSSIDKVFNILNQMILFIETDVPPPVGILFYSTYFTSVWFYLFMISSIGAKVIYSFGHFGNTIMDFFGVQKTPFQSMGTIIMILVTVGFVIYAVINSSG
ncbi:MAG: hypothetical protein KAT05_16315, partial [Spirochaetes bacterium]|nr:hypothetical protein [Spirochaetota bacterium]